LVFVRQFAPAATRLAGLPAFNGCEFPGAGGLGYGIETVQIIPFDLDAAPRTASGCNWHAASRAMLFLAAARSTKLLPPAGVEPELAASVTLRLLLKIATFCAAGLWVSPPANPKDSTAGMTILKFTRAVADTFPFSGPA
jgi:hypothetical protein